MIMKHIYLAAPIHKEEDADANALLIQALRDAGHMVWSPQEAGIASDYAKKYNKDLKDARQYYCIRDLKGMRASDVCVAYLGREREPSQGMLWEMGWFTGRDIPVLFYNPCSNPITLMAEFTASMVYTLPDLLKRLGEDVQV